jgi:sulfatase maturation enzyme AslB (radical SAM superfamily)
LNSRYQVDSTSPRNVLSCRSLQTRSKPKSRSVTSYHSTENDDQNILAPSQSSSNPSSAPRAGTVNRRGAPGRRTRLRWLKSSVYAQKKCLTCSFLKTSGGWCTHTCFTRGKWKMANIAKAPEKLESGHLETKSDISATSKQCEWSG